jgi:regulatory protein
MPKALKPIEDVAIAILARREHSTTEMARKLTQRGYARQEVEELLGQLVAKNLLNDARYAEVRARTRAETSKWGRGRIKQELALAGVKSDMAEQTLQTLEETHDWLQTATGLLQRHYAKPLISPLKAEDYQEYQKEKAKRIGFLTRKGYTLSQSLQALGLAGTEEDIEGL